jgi:hypothetical protein
VIRASTAAPGDVHPKQQENQRCAKDNSDQISGKKNGGAEGDSELEFHRRDALGRLHQFAGGLGFRRDIVQCTDRVRADT